MVWLFSSIITVCGLQCRVNRFAGSCFLGYNAGTEIISSEQCGTDEGGKTTKHSDNNKIKIKYKYDKNVLRLITKTNEQKSEEGGGST